MTSVITLSATRKFSRTLHPLKPGPLIHEFRILTGQKPSPAQQLAQCRAILSRERQRVYDLSIENANLKSTVQEDVKMINGLMNRQQSANDEIAELKKKQVELERELENERWTLERLRRGRDVNSDGKVYWTADVVVKKEEKEG